MTGFHIPPSLLSAPPPTSTTTDTGTALSSAGMLLSIGGALTGAIGTFYAAKTAQYQQKSQALSAEFAQSMSNLNARSAEQDAQLILEAGQRQAGQLTMEAGQVKGSQKASAAARGVRGTGSAAEIQASTDIAKEIDALTINANAVRAAGNARMQAQDERNQATMAGVTAANLRRSAGSIRPGLAAGTSLIGSAAGLADQWFTRRRRAAYGVS